MAVGLQIGGGEVLVLRGCVGVDVKNVSFSTVSGFETAFNLIGPLRRLSGHCFDVVGTYEEKKSLKTTKLFGWVMGADKLNRFL